MKKLLLMTLFIILFPVTYVFANTFYPNDGVYPPLTSIQAGRGDYFLIWQNENFVAEYVQSKVPLFYDSTKQAIVAKDKVDGVDTSGYTYRYDDLEYDWNSFITHGVMNVEDGYIFSNKDPITGNVYNQSTREITEIGWKIVVGNYDLLDYETGELVMSMDEFGKPPAYFISPIQDGYAVNHYTTFPDIIIKNNGVANPVITLYDGIRILRQWNVSPVFKEYTIPANEIPYNYNQLKITISDGTTVFDIVDFQIDKEENPGTARITGIIGGTDYKTQPKFTFEKYNMVSPVGLYFNDQLIYKSYQPTEKRYFEASKVPDVVGENVIELRLDSGEVLQSFKYTIMRETEDMPIDIGDYDENLNSPQPDRSAYDDGVLGSIEYGFDTLGYWITYPFKLVADGIKSLVSMISSGFDWVTDLSGIIGGWFSFLPVEVRTLLLGSFVCVIIAFIIRTFKG